MAGQMVTATASGRLTINNRVVSRGRGDTYAKMTKKVGIKPCGGCKKRQKSENKKHPYTGRQGIVNKVLKAIDKRL